ncbi:MAG: tripartite tricarboxylate transporter substrate binding protein BugD [Betaproteobacteria bacterium]|nr:tripartite tricarboxylate transporter substrate binding protein BugD [Betaproteobacteria bacterium]
MSRRVLCFALFAGLCAGAHAQSYPARSVSMVVPFAAGGATDVLARHFAERMSRGFGQTIIIENIAGAGGTIGAARVAKAKPDGYTLLVGHMGYMAAAVGLYSKLPYDPVQDFDAIARFPDTPLVLIVGRTSGLSDIRALIAQAKQSPGKINFGNAGVGSTGHLVATLFASAAGIEVTSVSYKGNAPALTDIVGGQIHGMFDQSNTALPQVRGQRVAAIAITSRQRMSQFPDVPTMQEAGLSGFEAATWYGIYAPKSTPRPIVDRVHAQFTESMQDKSFSDKLLEQGYQLLDASLTGPEALAAHTRTEVERWKKVIAEAKIPVN